LRGGSGGADETAGAGTSAEAGASVGAGAANGLVTSWAGGETASAAAAGLVASGAGLGISAEVMVAGGGGREGDGSVTKQDGI
jgi:hypothetical protein